ncbi:hypothetical protein OJF2_09120 [Aquisphaera giovannonii]|uniref:ATP-grasp domain-containing protein n=1 Tax=Aquisphaera giovannonii TaxID=406548 RepID=A0A5B9VX48_9BACT|nr:STM4014 family protein [Aquisphaera giovannonii]QEH32441.1 hypothetical protein OJF2_09120 [Aquisphaera giovannonii]
MAGHRPSLDLVVVANPGSRRLALLGQAMAGRGVPAPRVVSYEEYLRGGVRLARVLREGSVLRIESPGQDFEVERAILALGTEDERPGGSSLGREGLGRLAFDRGRILGPGQWYAGFSRLLRRIREDRTDAPPHAVMNDEESIAMLFDKPRCREHLVDGGIPCPRALGPVGGYDELRDRMLDARVGRVFVKLRCGSSASGIVAFESSGPRTQAFTTVEVVEAADGPRLYNSRRIRRLSDEREIARLIDMLAADGVHVEQWVPKAGLEGLAFDVRVVVIAGRAGHAVVRLGRGPMTNLHLKSRRGSVPTLRGRMGEPAWESLLETCRRVGEAFPGCQYLGVDVAVLPGYRRHVIFEANAFGDLLPGVLDPSGRDTYTAEIEALAVRPARSRP